MDEIDRFDLSFLQDLLLEEANAVTEQEITKNRPKRRRATQADFDLL